VCVSYNGLRYTRSSAKAQGIAVAMTSGARLRASNDRIYIFSDDGIRPAGFLKVSNKRALNVRHDHCLILRNLTAGRDQALVLLRQEREIVEFRYSLCDGFLRS
jgi:hypothetical protein